MNADEIRIALENATGIPEAALRAAVQEAASLAPAVIAVAQRTAGGTMPLPREERLLRFGLHALAAARETSACPAFLALLRLPAMELEWLFGEDRTQTVTQLLLGLFDGDDAAVCAVAADPSVDGEVQGGLMSALARLAWEGRASRERVLELLDRFDRETIAEVGSLAWLGWQEAILLLGLTDWSERVQRGWDAGRLPWLQHDVDRRDWIEQTREAAAHPEDPERFVDRSIMAIDDPVAEIGWSAEPASRPGDAPTNDEMAWLELMLWRRVTRGTMSLEEADGFLTALAAGPVPVSPAEFLPRIAGGSTDLPLFDTPEHDSLVGGLLVRRHAAIMATLRQAKRIAPWIGEGVGDLAGALWARGYMHGVSSHRTAWQPLSSTQRVAERVLMPIAALTPEMAGKGPVDLTAEKRQTIIRALPSLVSATRVYWTDGEAALFGAQPVDDQPVGTQPRRAHKVGRNEPCPCGSGKKYKRCCGALA
jgi:yecA family protein